MDNFPTAFVHGFFRSVLVVAHFFNWLSRVLLCFHGRFNGRPLNNNPASASPDLVENHVASDNGETHACRDPLVVEICGLRPEEGKPGLKHRKYQLFVKQGNRPDLDEAKFAKAKVNWSPPNVDNGREARDWGLHSEMFADFRPERGDSPPMQSKCGRECLGSGEQPQPPPGDSPSGTTRWTSNPTPSSG